MARRCGDLLPEVAWDRFTAAGDVISIYGWVPNTKHGRDFVLVVATEEEFLSFETSSAKYSRTFCERMGFSEHNTCHKISEAETT